MRAPSTSLCFDRPKFGNHNTHLHYQLTYTGTCIYHSYLFRFASQDGEARHALGSHAERTFSFVFRIWWWHSFSLNLFLTMETEGYWLLKSSRRSMVCCGSAIFLFWNCFFQLHIQLGYWIFSGNRVRDGIFSGICKKKRKHNKEAKHGEVDIRRRKRIQIISKLKLY